MISDLLDLVADWYWELDADLRFTQLKILNGIKNSDFTAQRCLHKHLWETDFEVQVGSDWEAQRQRLEQRQPFQDLIIHRPVQSGEECYLSLSGKPVFDGAQQFTGYRGIAKDVSAFQSDYENLSRFREAMDMCGDSIYLTDVSTMTFLDVNTTASEKMGYTRAELLKMGPVDLLMADRQSLEKGFQAVIDAGAQGVKLESTALSKTGQKSIAEVHRRPMKVGNRWIIVSIARDVTARKRAELAAVRLGRMYAALSATEEAILRTRSPAELFQRVCDAAVDGGKFLTTAVLLKKPNEKKLHLTAGSGHGLEVLQTTDISLDETQPSGRGLVGTACRTGRSRVSNDYYQDPDTAPWHALAQQIGIAAATAVPIRRGHETIGALLFYSDEKYAFDAEIVALLERMTESMVYALDNFDLEAERIRNQEHIHYIATHDALTSLPNRVMFHELLHHAVESGKRYGRKFALLFLDLDRFKFINDSLGHEAGDIVLQEMSARFKACLRASDVVARLGGDEFVILLDEISTTRQVSVTGKKLLAAAIKPVRALGQDCRVTASIGIALYPRDGGDESTLMKNADMAMYLAKEEGKNNFQFYSAEVKAHSLERMMLETGLRNALHRNELSLHYQPKMDSKTGRINGVEALLRWRSPELGQVSPMQLLPVAEETGLIIPIGRWVLKTACEQNVAWQREGLPPICVAINLSVRQFDDRDLLIDLATTLQETGMAPELLELELTESMVMRDVEHAVTLLKAIKDMGIRLAIDDFGTGYASLAQIKRFPIDILKVDRSFVRQIGHDPADSTAEHTENRAITDAILAMGKTLSLTVVAEGVETLEQEQYLRQHDCDEMQGYYFSRPLAAGDFATMLRGNAEPGKGAAL